MNDVRRLHKCQENYLALVELCDDEQWETAQAAMRNFDKSCPDWPDSENLRNLITTHLHRQALVKIADEARRRADWGSIRRVSHDLSEIDPGDPLAFSLLREAQLADEEDERNRRDRIGHARIHATAGNFQRCLELLKSNFVNSPVDILTAKALVELVDNLNIPLIWRLRAAKILGTTKDPRLPITSTEWQNELEQTNNKFGEPQSYWSFVRAGKYLIGGWQFGQSSAAVPLSAFWIGRYPITNEQFKYFVDTRSRKLDWRVWQKSYYSKSKGFEQLKSSPSNEPVHLASWHDATLFAGWLNLQIQGILHEDYIIRLPTEAEWEAAAAFDASGKRRSFPWGDELPSIDRVAYKESQLSGPNPVGIYPNQAACGAYDMAGNVWECTTSLSEKYPAGSHLSCYQFTDNDAISWRGGDTDSNDDQLLCSYRSEWCMFENMSGGFRLVIAKK